EDRIEADAPLRAGDADEVVEPADEPRGPGRDGVGGGLLELGRGLVADRPLDGSLRQLLRAAAQRFFPVPGDRPRHHRLASQLRMSGQTVRVASLPTTRSMWPKGKAR